MTPARFAPLLALLAALPAGGAENAVDALKAQGPKDAKGNTITVAVAAPEGKAVESKALSITDCTPEQLPGMETAIRAARAKVDSCLSGINPKMASEISRLFDKFRFSCYQEPRGAGGDTRHDLNAKGNVSGADISITMRSRMIQYSKESRVFHEMIHAIDPPATNQSAKTNRDGHFIISAARHAKAGFPDAVYGCQFSCYPNEIGEDEAKVIRNYNDSTANIPESTKDIPVDNASPYAKLHVKQYAYLCETGKPIAPKDLIDKDRAANMPTCVAEGLLNSCDAADDASCKSPRPPRGALCGLRCETLIDEAANGGRISRRLIDKMFALGRRLADATANGGADLSEEDRVVYADAQKKGLIRACR